MISFKKKDKDPKVYHYNFEKSRELIESGKCNRVFGMAREFVNKRTDACQGALNDHAFEDEAELSLEAG